MFSQSVQGPRYPREQRPAKKPSTGRGRAGCRASRASSPSPAFNNLVGSDSISWMALTRGSAKRSSCCTTGGPAPANAPSSSNITGEPMATDVPLGPRPSEISNVAARNTFGGGASGGQRCSKRPALVDRTNDAPSSALCQPTKPDVNTVAVVVTTAISADSRTPPIAQSASAMASILACQETLSSCLAARPELGATQYAPRSGPPRQHVAAVSGAAGAGAGGRGSRKSWGGTARGRGKGRGIGGNGTSSGRRRRSSTGAGLDTTNLALPVQVSCEAATATASNVAWQQHQHQQQQECVALMSATAGCPLMGPDVEMERMLGSQESMNEPPGQIGSIGLPQFHKNYHQLQESWPQQPQQQQQKLCLMLEDEDEEEEGGAEYGPQGGSSSMFGGFLGGVGVAGTSSGMSTKGARGRGARGSSSIGSGRAAQEKRRNVNGGAGVSGVVAGPGCGGCSCCVSALGLGCTGPNGTLSVRTELLAPNEDLEGSGCGLARQLPGTQTAPPAGVGQPLGALLPGVQRPEVSRIPTDMAAPLDEVACAGQRHQGGVSSNLIPAGLSGFGALAGMMEVEMAAGPAEAVPGLALGSLAGATLGLAHSTVQTADAAMASLQRHAERSWQISSVRQHRQQGGGGGGPAGIVSSCKPPVAAGEAAAGPAFEDHRHHQLGLLTSADGDNTGPAAGLPGSMGQEGAVAGQEEGGKKLHDMEMGAFRQGCGQPQGGGCGRSVWAGEGVCCFTDIDCHSGDPQLCSAYAVDIFQHLRASEQKRRPDPSYMEGVQSDINQQMRGILIDWLVEVAEEYKLVADTLYLTCSFIDRYLSRSSVTRGRLQLLGVSCMLIASKYEEIYAPQVDEFCYITDNTYRREEVIEMERAVLKELHFELSYPTTKSFLRRFVRAAQADLGAPSVQLELLGNYFAELTLVDYHSIRFLPSLVAASSVLLAKHTLWPDCPKPWSATLQHYTGYRLQELEECTRNLHDLQVNRRGCTLPAIREKYRQDKFQRVALITPRQELPASLFQEGD